MDSVFHISLYILGHKGPFKWFDYLKQTKAIAAPVKLFDKVSTSPVVLEICCFLSVVNPYNVSVSVDNKEVFDFRTYLNMVLRVG